MDKNQKDRKNNQTKKLTIIKLSPSKPQKFLPGWTINQAYKGQLINNNIFPIKTNVKNTKEKLLGKLILGAIFILRKDIGVGWWS